MTRYAATTIQVPVASGDQGLGKLTRDDFLTEFSNSAVRFLFDTDFSFSYPGAAGTPANPTSGQVVYDVAELANGSALTTSSQVTYAGGGFDLSATASMGQGIAAPASVMADIATAYSGVSQKFLAMMYCKLPSSANWPASGATVSIMGDAPDNAAAGALGSVNMIGFTSSGRLQGRRQTAASTGDTSAALSAPDFSQLAQVAWWRSATEYKLRVKTANNSILFTGSVGSDNSNASSFAANSFVFGRPNAFGGSGVLTAFSGFRVYRGAMVNLARSTPSDVAAVLDRDWARIVARGTFV